MAEIRSVLHHSLPFCGAVFHPPASPLWHLEAGLALSLISGLSASCEAQGLPQTPPALLTTPGLVTPVSPYAIHATRAQTKGKQGLAQQAGAPSSMQCSSDLLCSSLTASPTEEEGGSIMEQFICKCLKYQIKVSPLAFSKKKKEKTLLNFLVFVLCCALLCFSILARQSTLTHHLFGFLILQLHPCCTQTRCRARISLSCMQGGARWGGSGHPWDFMSHWKDDPKPSFQRSFQPAISLLRAVSFQLRPSSPARIEQGKMVIEAILTTAPRGTAGGIALEPALVCLAKS